MHSYSREDSLGSILKLWNAKAGYGTWFRWDPDTRIFHSVENNSGTMASLSPTGSLLATLNMDSASFSSHLNISPPTLLVSIACSDAWSIRLQRREKLEMAMFENRRGLRHKYSQRIWYCVELRSTSENHSWIWGLKQRLTSQKSKEHHDTKVLQQKLHLA